MTNVKLTFYGSEKSKTEDHELVCYANIKNNIYMKIDMGYSLNGFICLDKKTAIRLHKELKKQISFLKD